MWSLWPFVAAAFSPPAVVGGRPAEEGAWPDAVAVYTFGDSVACSGVLVAPDVVVTAGHCGYGVRSVLVGTTDLRAGGQRVAVEAVTIHDDPFETLDLAVLWLAEEVRDVVPATLVQGCLVPGVVDGAAVAIVGFGATDEQGTAFPTALMEAETTIRDADCSTLSTGCRAAVSPGAELVAGGGGVDSCVGDSGGPLYLLGADQAWLVGITSRAAQPADQVCGDGGIYVRADAVAGWLDELGVPLVAPDCEGLNSPPAAEAEPIVVQRRAVAATRIQVRDPDPRDTHTFALIGGDADVEAWLEGDLLLVRAPADRSAHTELRVRVTDDGVPPLSVELAVPVEVTVASAATGCAHGSATGSAWVLALLSVAARRAPGPRRRGW